MHGYDQLQLASLAFWYNVQPRALVDPVVGHHLVK